MALVRLRVACRGRVELHEIERSDIEIGRDESCDLSVAHASVAARHARILVRRNRLILAGMASARTSLNAGDRLFAPVTLAPGEEFSLGDVTFSAWLVHSRERGLARTKLPRGDVLHELESADPDIRRYELRNSDGARCELAATTRDVDPSVGGSWVDRLRPSAGSLPHVASLIAVEMIDERATLLERVPPGIRLSSLAAGMKTGLVHVPVEAMIVVLAHLAEAVAALGGVMSAHGALDPAYVQLGIDGSITLLRPGPKPNARSLADELVAPERRFTFEATPAGDAFALGKIGARLLDLCEGAPPRIRAICTWLAHAEPHRRPGDLNGLAAELRRAATRGGLDPTYGHVARAARVLTPSHERPLATVAAGLGE